FLHEEWAGRRLHSPHILKILERPRRRSCLYFVTEYIEGATLRQWMSDHPRPSIIEARKIVNQIATGLMAFHRMEMIHRDLKPDNVLIDPHGTVKIIDFGASKIAGIEEIAVPWARSPLLGTRNYTAPEYLNGASGTERSDLFSLGVIAYEMLTGKPPYKEELNVRNLTRISYIPARRRNPDIPVWLDKTLEKAIHKDPVRRYTVLSEFLYDLSHPNAAFLSKETPPLLERDPVVFWKGLALLFFLANVFLLYLFSR
ncbi:MAG: serine/threonine protein kinase, partial [Nitrospiria bacterium]